MKTEELRWGSPTATPPYEPLMREKKGSGLFFNLITVADASGSERFVSVAGLLLGIFVFPYPQNLLKFPCLSLASYFHFSSSQKEKLMLLPDFIGG